jgi:hypothetical protein
MITSSVPHLAAPVFPLEHQAQTFQPLQVSGWWVQNTTCTRMTLRPDSFHGSPGSQNKLLQGLLPAQRCSLSCHCPHAQRLCHMVSVFLWAMTYCIPAPWGLFSSLTDVTYLSCKIQASSLSPLLILQARHVFLWVPQCCSSFLVY